VQGELGRGLQLALGVGLLVVNVAAYAALHAKRLRAAR
jgi:hypothetical protein